MMRLWPCEEPRAWGGANRSSPSTFKPRRERAWSEALPMAPRPTTIASNDAATGALVLDGAGRSGRWLGRSRRGGPRRPVGTGGPLRLVGLRCAALSPTGRLGKRGGLARPRLATAERHIGEVAGMDVHERVQHHGSEKRTGEQVDRAKEGSGRAGQEDAAHSLIRMPDAEQHRRHAGCRDEAQPVAEIPD